MKQHCPKPSYKAIQSYLNGACKKATLPIKIKTSDF